MTAGFDEAGARTCSVDAGGIFGPFGSVSFVATKIDAMPSTITPMTGSDHLRAKSAARLDSAGASAGTAVAHRGLTFVVAGLFAADSADS